MTGRPVGGTVDLVHALALLRDHNGVGAEVTCEGSGLLVRLESTLDHRAVEGLGELLGDCLRVTRAHAWTHTAPREQVAGDCLEVSVLLHPAP